MRPEPELLLETRRFRVVRHAQPLADGTIHHREAVVHPGAVVIVGLIEPRQVVLIRNYRIAVDEELLELPAGTIDPGEDPLETARRELAEETGYRADAFRRLTDFWVSPGILSERMHLFLATGLRPGPAAPEKGEQIRPLVADWDEALAMIDQQKIRDAKTLAGLLYYDRLLRLGSGAS
ncbi:MAG TPA: NUDIX hydrolase [Pirellulales bacterium]|jgi:ADP-ribose pyrophosphatase|nr:NUDIX hydrolase [Pirellulales bacterium]